MRRELASQKSFFEHQMESVQSQVTNLQGQVETLQKEAVDGYNSGLEFCYKCIMTVLGRQYPDLKMDRLEAGVIEYMQEQDGNGDEGWDKPPQTTATVTPPDGGDPSSFAADKVDPPLSTA